MSRGVLVEPQRCDCGSFPESRKHQQMNFHMLIWHRHLLGRYECQKRLTPPELTCVAHARLEGSLQEHGRHLHKPLEAPSLIVVLAKAC
jgi:hypothetical protein